MNINIKSHGILPTGKIVDLYILDNGNGMIAEISAFGGALTRLLVPDKLGNAVDVVLGHNSLDGYLVNNSYLGVLIGRNANRITGGKFTLGDMVYQLEKNNGDNNLHSGSFGLHTHLFSGKVVLGDSVSVELRCNVADKSDGFPGNLDVRVTYTLTSDNMLKIDYFAVSDADTVINLTHHSYFNLAGHDSGNIGGHIIQLRADYFMPGTPEGLPTGEIVSVSDSPFDLRSPQILGKLLGADCGQLRQYDGFDHTFVLQGNGYHKFATVTEPKSGRVMEAFTDMPGVQLYTGNALESGIYKDSVAYSKHQGFCLETQFLPNGINMPWVVSPVFYAGEEFRFSTGFRFG